MIPSNYPSIEFTFPINAQKIPLDHGWTLYSALSKTSPSLHERKDLIISPIFGGLNQKDGFLYLSDQARLSMRSQAEDLGSIFKLAGKRFEISNCNFSLGVPTTKLIAPCSELYSRIVIVANNPEWEGVERQLRHQLDILGIQCLIIPGKRRIMKIKNFINIGYAVGLKELTEEASLRILSLGLGGRRKMGAGFFLHGTLPLSWEFNTNKE